MQGRRGVEDVVAGRSRAEKGVVRGFKCQEEVFKTVIHGILKGRHEHRHGGAPRQEGQAAALGRVILPGDGRAVGGGVVNRHRGGGGVRQGYPERRRLPFKTRREIRGQTENRYRLPVVVNQLTAQGHAGGGRAAAETGMIRIIECNDDGLIPLRHHIVNDGGGQGHGGAPRHEGQAAGET